ncbi:30S ribosomal protein S19 [Candidatus Parvarchaeota archaeon]|nr:30S ribosomal protein S19 [Candidatus Parvarchaeota archaeon]
MAKITTFQGKTAQELEGLGQQDALAMLNSRSRRAMNRSASSSKNYRLKTLIKKVVKIKALNDAKKIIKTHVRDAVILPEWLGLTFGVHNGKEFKNVLVTIDRIGYRLGDFAHTTGRVLHSGPGVGATRGSKFIPLK